MSIFSHPEFDNHQWLSFKQDADCGLKAIIAIHNSNLGTATGGCRMYPYATEDAALADVLRLSRGMTYKSALAGIPFGGGKSVIIGDPAKHKSRALLLAMGKFVDSHNGRYTIAEDSGTTVSDMAVMAERTCHVSGLVTDDEHGGDPSPTTAYGVFIGIQSAVQYRLRCSLQGVRVAIQGVGQVGFQLAKLLSEAGAEVLVADINPVNTQRAVAIPGVKSLPLEAVLSAEVDVLAPCAMGAAINTRSIDTIKASVVAGAANNQLASPEMGAALMARGILYAPDYVINAGGIINVYYQTIADRNVQHLHNHVNRIAVTLSAIFKRATAENLPTSVVADLMAEEVFKHPHSASKVA